MMTRAILAGIMVLALAAPAQAGTVGYDSSGGVVFHAAPGEANDVRVTFGPDDVTIQDATAPTAEAGCIPAEFNGVTCARTVPTNIVLAFGDRNDEMTATPTADTGALFHIDGGAGSDRLWGGPGSDAIVGSTGNDFIYGQGGKDSLSGRGGNDRIQGQGVLRGGPGKDFIDTLFDDEGSKSIVSRLFGDAGNDRFVTGNGAKEIVNCGRGKDQVTRTLPTGRRDRRDRIKRNCEHRL